VRVEGAAACVLADLPARVARFPSARGGPVRMAWLVTLASPALRAFGFKELQGLFPEQYPHFSDL
jgi:hypothetical protein